MKNIFEYKEDLGTSYIVLAKIRELHMSFGELAITFDNGEKRVLSVQDPESVLKAMLEAIENQS
ncbi:MAG: hypothetical protein LHW64_04940 [Candidatus Cloacimonetes bacterium]|jgi:hypothetical protein|nr:hypothetical protein [Candidatus Cloacimonadota bacterium]MCB5287128.1 hypothetical protein [Candidatus Cloacimonadota bacterium]MCK9183949.1 hypothetical protein [Candidatus Cloacimonadota bacterium]MCK9584571.1 hypothetical protein [Candidatus Cloacimonadota bacterium]MDY0229449.1 hypothetical protein [Candidatus Cloacimonadaceae bacterium]